MNISKGRVILMKNLGMVRRSDDLGRIVIPKKIRKQLNIEEGDPLEFWLDDNNNLVLKKTIDKIKYL